MSQPDPQLDAFLGESRAAVDHRAANTPRSHDFMDVVRRAHALDPEAVGDDVLDEAQQLAPVVDIRSGSEEALPDPELDGFVGEVREALKQRVSDRQLAPIPAMRGSAPAGPRRALIGSMLGLVAAALVGWLALGDVTLMTPDELESASEQSVNLGAATTESGGEAVDRGARPEHSSRSSDDAVEATAAPAAPPEAEPLAEVEDADALADDKISTRRPRSERKGREDRLRAMLAAAKAQWQGGQEATAKATLGRLVRIGGRSRHVQSAYADLFVLAHQSGNDAERRRLWRAYVRRFPRGRYADDARAGLCRTATQAQSCWGEYLEDFSRGSYRAEANRALQDSGRGSR